MPAGSDPAPAGPPLSTELPDADVGALMWKHDGVFRDRPGLVAALDALEPAWTAVDRGLREGRGLDAASWRLSCLVTVSRLVARAALAREESRGAHWRADFPARDDLHWKRRWYQTRV